MKLCSIVLGLVLVASVGRLSSGKIVQKADEQQELFEDNKFTNHHEDNEIDPRPNTKGFGLPHGSVDSPVGSHDVHATNKNLKAHHDALEYTQLLSGSIEPRGQDPRRDNPLATVQRFVDAGENLVANTLHDHLGLSIPTKLIEGQDVEQGEELIKIATALLKDLIAMPRQHGRLPLGISSSSSSPSPSLSSFSSTERSRHGVSNINSEDIGRGNSNTADPQLVQRSMLEIIEQLTRMALDEPSNLQDAAFEQLLDRIKLLIMGFRAKPILRT